MWVNRGRGSGLFACNTLAERSDLTTDGTDITDNQEQVQQAEYEKSISSFSIRCIRVIRGEPTSFG